MRSEPLNLTEILKEIQNLNQGLKNIEDSSGIKNYGYKPWSDPNADEHIISSKREVLPITLSDTPLKTPRRSARLAKTPRSEKKSERKKELFKEKSERKVPEKCYGRTPQPHDFGITKRFTLVPQQFLKNKFESTPDKPKEICAFHVATNSPLIAPNEDVQVTPTNNDFSHLSQDQETVEFTPGLTTQRPKAVKRVKEVSHRKITPEEPISSLDEQKASQLLKSIKKKGVNGTPQMPDIKELQLRLARSRTTNRRRKE